MIFKLRDLKAPGQARMLKPRPARPTVEIPQDDLERLRRQTEKPDTQLVRLVKQASLLPKPLMQPLYRALRAAYGQAKADQIREAAFYELLDEVKNVDTP
jgi:hypothetical protein